jgi:acyl-CoA thioester hydrolase
MTNPDPTIGLAREPTGGWFEGRTHVFPVRVYYEDTDFSGLVYHANYLRFMERGRSEFLRISGAGHQTILNSQEPLVWAVRRMTIDFARPARMEDALAVRTRVVELAGARMRLDQRVLKETTLLVKAEVEVCIITLDGRPRRVPPPLRKKLEFFLET